jgi:20S proteasome alpha/beta subunit
MRMLIVTIVGLLVGAISSSTLGQYSHGTAVIALPTGNKILFAADSSLEYRSTTTNDACKITKVDDKTIFTQAGVGGIGPSDNSFVIKAAQLVKEKPIHTQEDLMWVATNWTM